MSNCEIFFSNFYFSDKLLFAFFIAFCKSNYITFLAVS